jgi:hypothetical protein
VSFAFAILVVGPVISIANITANQVPRALALTVRLVSIEFWIPIATLEVGVAGTVFICCICIPLFGAALFLRIALTFERIRIVGVFRTTFIFRIAWT